MFFYRSSTRDLTQESENVPGRMVKMQEQAGIKYPACRATSDRQTRVRMLFVRGLQRMEWGERESGDYKIER